MWHDPALLLEPVTSGLNDSCGAMGSRDGDGAHSPAMAPGSLLCIILGTRASPAFSAVVRLAGGRR
jgi:hypothetical protein